METSEFLRSSIGHVMSHSLMYHQLESSEGCPSLLLCRVITEYYRPRVLAPHRYLCVAARRLPYSVFSFNQQRKRAAFMAKEDSVTILPTPPALSLTGDTPLDGLAHASEEVSDTKAYKRNFRFWMICICLTTSQFITALELSAISNALPTIVEVLRGE